MISYNAGSFLREEVKARGWTQAAFATILGRPTQWVSEVMSGKKKITARSALQIGAALGTSAELWMNLQQAHDIETERGDRALAYELRTIRARAESSSDPDGGEAWRKDDTLGPWVTPTDSS